jgi:hypothetical protein
MKIKALFLLVVFLSYHMIGIACALQFSTKVAKATSTEGKPENVSVIEEPAVAPHAHAKGTPPHHHELAKPITSLKQSGTPQHEENKESSEPGKNDGCCQDDVDRISSEAKVVPQKGADVKIPVFEVVNHLQNIVSTSLLIKGSKGIFYSDVEYPPPKTDIRVFIQSFQI